MKVLTKTKTVNQLVKGESLSSYLISRLWCLRQTGRWSFGPSPCDSFSSWLLETHLMKNNHKVCLHLLCHPRRFILSNFLFLFSFEPLYWSSEACSKHLWGPGDPGTHKTISLPHKMRSVPLFAPRSCSSGSPSHPEKTATRLAYRVHWARGSITSVVMEQ